MFRRSTTKVTNKSSAWFSTGVCLLMTPVFALLTTNPLFSRSACTIQFTTHETFCIRVFILALMLGHRPSALSFCFCLSLCSLTRMTHFHISGLSSSRLVSSARLFLFRFFFLVLCLHLLFRPVFLLLPEYLFRRFLQQFLFKRRASQEQSPFRLPLSGSFHLALR